MFFILFGLIF